MRRALAKQRGRTGGVKVIVAGAGYSDALVPQPSLRWWWWWWWWWWWCWWWWWWWWWWIVITTPFLPPCDGRRSPRTDVAQTNVGLLAGMRESFGLLVWIFRFVIHILPEGIIVWKFLSFLKIFRLLHCGPEIFPWGELKDLCEGVISATNWNLWCWLFSVGQNFDTSTHLHLLRSEASLESGWWWGEAAPRGRAGWILARALSSSTPG